jgi:hypothetical protein
MDQERLRYDVWTNVALQQEDEAYLGIFNFYGKPNNPYKNTKNFFKLLHDKEREATRNGKFKSESHRQWNDAIDNSTYISRL